MPNYLTTRLTVHSDGYKYDVELSENEHISLTYSESIDSVTISFASVEEMEAVAKAMLRAVKFHKED